MKKIPGINIDIHNDRQICLAYVYSLVLFDS